MPSDLNSIERAIGRVEGKIDGLHESIQVGASETARVEAQTLAAMKAIENRVTALERFKNWMIGAAFVMSLLLSVVWEWLRKKFFG